MPSFSYTGGDISHLTGGFTPASMADIQGPFTDLRTALNGGLDEVNVPNLSAAFTTYKDILRAFSGHSAVAAGIYAMSLSGPPATTDIVFNTANSAPWAVLIYLDPADYTANARSTRLRVRAVAVPSGAPAVTFTVGLYPIATYTGAGGGAHARAATLGTVVSGSTAAIASPASAVATKVDSSDFSFPAAGAYVLAVQTSGTPAAGTITDLIASLQMRQV